MKSPNTLSFARLTLAACFLLVACTSTYANSIAVSLVGSDSPPGAHTGSAYDSSTGKYYRRNYFSTGLLVYNNLSDFEANVNSSTLSLGGGGTAGTYFAVMNGKVYSRSDNSSNSVSIWDANTGTELASTSIAAMSGINGSDTFDWGGYSGMNFIDDGNSLYLFGNSSTGSQWIVSTMDSNLNVTSSLGYSQTSLGYAFIINGTLFSGADYNSPTINRAMNLSTGMESAVDFTLTGLGAFHYLTNFDYVSATDTLYIHNVRTGNMYKAAGAGAAFGVPFSSVPDSGSTAILIGSAIAGIALLRRKLASV